MSLVHFGDRFRLRWVSRKRGSEPLYLIAAEKGGREYYPRVGSIADAVLLTFAAPAGQPQDRTGQPVSSRATVQLITTEESVGATNTLGAWGGDHFLYYRAAGNPEQDWQLDVDSNSRLNDGKLHSGDNLIIANRRADERPMTQDSREPNYLSLDPTAKGSWQIEPA